METSSSWSEDSGYFSGGDFYSSEQQAQGTEETRAQGSLISAGGNLHIDAGRHTQVTGALVATVDEEGKELGKLDLTTETLDYADLSTTNYSSQRSAGISTSVGLNGANPADPRLSSMRRTPAATTTCA